MLVISAKGNPATLETPEPLIKLINTCAFPRIAYPPALPIPSLDSKYQLKSLLLKRLNLIIV